MRHRFHSICPYFAMFPETFVEKHLAASRYNGVVFDPFCGRGTAIFESLLRGRAAAGCDVHPVAVCITAAKCNPPSSSDLLKRIQDLENNFHLIESENITPDFEEFFSACFHMHTYAQVLFLRRYLNWKNDYIDCFLAALSLGALHGESHRSPNYFSNRMPRTISTKPAYSVRWWRQNGYKPPYRDVFDILRNMVAYRYRTVPPEKRGEVALIDARAAYTQFEHLVGEVTDVITSPPYLDTTNYREDQWLRLWFLGEPARSTYNRADARHCNKEAYWSFLQEAWAGLSPLLADDARLVIRIGGRRIEKEEMLSSLTKTLRDGLRRKVQSVDDGVTTPVKRTQANSFRGSKASPTVEHDFCFLVGG